MSAAPFQDRHSGKIEVAALALAIGFVAYTLRPLLFLGTKTWPHDGAYWGFPIFHYFAESLMNGALPLWNPFDHAGEPFFPLLFADRCLDPTAILAVLVGKHFTTDTVVLSHWARFLQSVLTLLGGYLCLRMRAKELWIRLALIPLLFFSYFLIGSFRQPSLMYVFAWLPFLVYFLIRVFYLGERRLSHWLWIGLFIGIQWQHYLFAGTWTFLLFFGIGLLLFDRVRLFAVLGDRRNWGGIGLCALIVALMLGPNLYLFLTQRDFIFPARMVPQEWETYKAPLRGALGFEGGPKNIVPPLRLSYAVAHFTGTVAWMWDYLQAVIPDGAFAAAKEMDGNWRGFHDGQFYLGTLVWLITAIGVLFGSGSGRRVWLVCAVGLTLVILGKGGGLHPLLYYVFPPLQMMRHTSGLMEIVLFFWLFFFVDGLRVVQAWWRREIPLPRLSIPQFAGSLALSVGLAALLNFFIFKRSEDYAYLFIYPALVAAWGVRKRLGLAGLALVGVLGPVLFTMGEVSNLPYYLFHLAVFTALPVLVFAVSYHRNSPQRGGLLAFFFLGIIVIEFTTNLQMGARLYDERPHPMRVVLVDTYRLPPELPRFRRPFPPTIQMPGDTQSVRYLSVVYRVPTALSTPLPPNRGVVIDTFEKGLAALRWNSLLLPKHYFSLLHSGVAPEVMKKLFAVGEDVFQFKPRALRIDDEEAVKFFNFLKPEGARGWLDQFVLLAPRDGEKLGPITLGTPGEFAYRVKEYSHGRFSIEVTNSEPGYLTWADGYDKNWRATVDGKPAILERANFNFKALRLPPGRHTLEFHYEPFWFLVSLFLFYAAMGTGILGACLLSWPRRMLTVREERPRIGEPAWA